MKYLKTYNENNFVFNVCKGLTGYTEQELNDIFMLNLEDNTEFEALKFNTGAWPDTSNLRPTKISDTVNCVLWEDFNGNAAVVNVIRESSAKFMHMKADYLDEMREMICGINEVLLDKIAKKYDLNITDIKLSAIQTQIQANNTAVVEFKISKS